MRTNCESSSLRHVGRRASGRGRIGAFEPLDNRIALSAGGVAPFMFELNADSRVFESSIEHVRAVGLGGEFTSIKPQAWQSIDGTVFSNTVVTGVDVLRDSIAAGSVGRVAISGEGRQPGDDLGRQHNVLRGANELDQPPILVNTEFAAYRITETRIAPAKVQLAGTSVVLPGLLVSRGDAVTLLVSTSPLIGISNVSQANFRIEGREPNFGDRSWSPRASLPMATQQVVEWNDDHHADRMPAAIGAMPGPSGSAVPPRTGDSPVFTRIDLRANGAESFAAWGAGFRAEPETRSTTPPTQAAQVTGQWAISKSDLDEGLIELESPLSPRRKGRKLPSESAETADQGHDPWSPLQTLAEHVWSAWNDAWREFRYEDEQVKESAANTESVERNPPVAFNADVVDGLVELVVEESGATEDAPRPAREQLANDDTPVRIDAGVAIFQRFEMATAADAAPPATVRKTERKAEGDEHAEAERPAEGQPISAAAVGAGLIIGLPISLLRRRPHEDDREGRAPRLRTT